MRYLLLTVPACLAVAACGPKTVEGYTAAPSATGNPAYSVHGFTQPGERNPEFGEIYARTFGEEVCPGPVTVVRVDTTPSRNAFAEFLYWQAIIECADPAAVPAPADVEAEAAPAAPTPPPAAAVEDPGRVTPAPPTGSTPGQPLPLAPTTGGDTGAPLPLAPTSEGS